MKVRTSNTQILTDIQACTIDQLHYHIVIPTHYWGPLHGNDYLVMLVGWLVGWLAC